VHGCGVTANIKDLVLLTKIAELQDATSTNTAGIAANSTNIATNTADIATNTVAIATNSAKIDALLLAPGYRLLEVTYLTTTGITNTFNQNSLANYFIIQIVGAGGAGGGAVQTAGTAYSAGSGGGAGAFFQISGDTSVIGASPYTYSIGVGGVPVSGDDGGDGGGSTFASSSVTFSAGGGLGGLFFVSPAPTSIAGGVGGATVSDGDIIYDGQDGNYALSIGTDILGFLISGAGGNTIFGTGGASSVSLSDLDGLPGKGYGAGGGGAAASHSGDTNFAGGKGAQGIIIIYQYTNINT